MPDSLDHTSKALLDAIQWDRTEFSARVRAGRAALGWSQGELAKRAGVAPRSIVRLEQGESDVRRSTAVAVEQVLQAEGLSFETLSEGGFRLSVPRKSLAPRAEEP